MNHHQRFSSSLLQRLAVRTCEGHAIWSVLTTNEYLDPGDPLARVLHRKAKDACPASTHHSESERHLLERIYSGAALDSFSEEEQAVLQKLDRAYAGEVAVTRIRSIPERLHIPQERTMHARRALRKRA